MEASKIMGLPLNQNPAGVTELDLEKQVDLFLQLV
jgi:hypothetical protein